MCVLDYQITAGACGSWSYRASPVIVPLHFNFDLEPLSLQGLDDLIGPLAITRDLGLDEVVDLRLPRYLERPQLVTRAGGALA